MVQSNIEVSAQYKLFSLIKYNKIMEYVRNHLEVITKQKIIHCIIDNDLSLHLVKYTNRFILQISKYEKTCAKTSICLSKSYVNI